MAWSPDHVIRPTAGLPVPRVEPSPAGRGQGEGFLPVALPCHAFHSVPPPRKRCQIVAGVLSAAIPPETLVIQSTHVKINLLELFLQPQFANRVFKLIKRFICN